MDETIISYLPGLYIALGLLLIGAVYMVMFRCTFCFGKITQEDRMLNGRVRYRKIGTNLPVCKCCANKRYSEVE